MTPRTLILDDALSRYLHESSLREHPVARKLRAATQRLPGATMQIAPEQGQLMALLARMIGARRAIEIGTYTGYSALVLALALPADGTLICCDVNRETTAVGRKYWKEAGVELRIDLRIAPALETVAALLANGEAEEFDLAFIDADKSNYDRYYESCLELIRPGGLILIDNVLWGGSVADSREKDPTAAMFRKLNAKIRDDARVDMSLVAIGDGLTVVRKR